MNSPNRWLLTILRAAHCRSTHHHFAIDALPMISTEPGRRLAGHLMRHHHRYLAGAKDPDTRFRDFQNHVIHVDDGYWGGAPRVAHQWYDRLQKYLRQDRWSDAAHAAGVLSHYFTDPIQPLHTGQTIQEKVLHRPIEWSITKSYASLFLQWKNDPTRIVFQLSDGPGWLGDAILQSAHVAHQHYDTIIDHYDLKAGRLDPPSGLDTASRGCLSQLIGLCVTGWARVLERAANDAEQARDCLLPEQGTSLATVLAGIRVPKQVWLRRIEHKAEQRKVIGLIDEFEQTGIVSEFLPSEVRILEKVRKVYDREREFNKMLLLQASKPTIRILEDSVAEPEKTTVSVASATQMQSMVEPIAVAPLAQTIAFESANELKVRLHIADALVDAPSIGPKTASRFAAIGIRTVGDFLAESPEAMAERLATRWITRATLHSWRCQTILMCQLPEMLARETQMLVGAGYPTADKIAKTNADTILAEILQYAQTYTGLRQLRGALPPTLERVEEWVDEAALALVRQKRAMARRGSPNASQNGEPPKEQAPTADSRAA